MQLVMRLHWLKKVVGCIGLGVCCMHLCSSKLAEACSVLLLMLLCIGRFGSNCHLLADWLKLPFVGRLVQTAIGWQMGSNCHWLAVWLKCAFFNIRQGLPQNKTANPWKTTRQTHSRKIVFKRSNSRNMTPKTETQKHQMRNPLVCQGWIGHCQSLPGKRWGTTCKKTGEPKHNRNNNHHH